MAIPLFRSARFVDNVSANIEALPADVEILVSDRHGHDDSIDQLERRHGHDPRLRFLRRFDGKTWVDHISDLLWEARGEFWRLMPHDDFSSREALEALADCLEAHPDTLLAYGPTTAVDLEGNRLPERDHLDPHPIHNDAPWHLGLILDSFSRGHFNGAFKGLVRRATLVERGLRIRPTRDNEYAERMWLAALGLVGRFRFVPDAPFVKRFHPYSAHAQWRRSAAHELSGHRVFLGYCKDLMRDPACTGGSAPTPRGPHSCDSAWSPRRSILPSLNPSYPAAPRHPTAVRGPVGSTVYGTIGGPYTVSSI